MSDLDRVWRVEANPLATINAAHSRAAREIDEQVRTELARVAAIKSTAAPLDKLPEDLPPALRKMAMRVAASSLGMIKRL